MQECSYKNVHEGLRNINTKIVNYAFLVSFMMYCTARVRISLALKRFFLKCSSRTIKDLLKHGDSVWFTLSIVDYVLTVYDVRGRRKFWFEHRCNCSAPNVAIDNVSPDFTAPVFGFEDHWRNRRELEVVEREVQ